MKRSSLARRYARALLETAIRLEAGDEVRRSLCDIAKLLNSRPELRSLFLSRRATAEVKGRVVRKVLGDRCHPAAEEFCRLASDHRDIRLFADTAIEYAELLDRALNRVRATATAALPMGAEETRRLAARLGEATGKRVALETVVDPALLGGIALRIGNRVIDGSLKTKLTAMTRQLAHSR